MDPHVARAQVLIEQGRYEMAEQQIRQALVSEPNDPRAHAFLALCLVYRDRSTEALTAVRQAIHLAPDADFSHYIHALVLERMERESEAEAAIRNAIEINPTAAESYALLARLQRRRCLWREVLKSTEQGLQFDAENVSCMNLRAEALLKLGRKNESHDGIQTALSRDPDNAVTHANQGWLLLERGDRQKAMEHFREALRLDPTMDWARHGIVESLKAGNIVYRVMLKYFFWMSRFSGRGKWMVIIGAWLLLQVVTRLLGQHPEWGLVLWPVIIAYIVFAFLTWTADALFNLLLRLHRFGRLALSPYQILTSNFVLFFIVVGVVGIGGGILLKSRLLTAAGILGALMIVPVAGTFRLQRVRGRMIMMWYTIGLGLLAVVGWTMAAVGIESGTSLTGLFFIGVLLFPWISNILGHT